MKLLYLAAFVLCLCLQPFAQLPQVYLKKKQSLALGAQAKSSPLVVVIENEKNADDAALISAVKAQWTIGPVSYMSELEFSEKLKSGTLDVNNLYLFNNFKKDYAGLSGMKVTFGNPNKVTKRPFFPSGFYLTNNPLKLINSSQDKAAPPYLHFSANALYDNRKEPIKGFYSLMIKNFDHDIKYCQDESNFKKKKKIKYRHGVSIFTGDSLANKTILLVKEQTERTTKQDKKKNSEKINNAKAKKEYVTDKVSDKKPVIVFPEDIDHAVTKSDPDVMLYTGGCLYRAKDGSVVATTRGKKQSTVSGGLIVYYAIVIAVGSVLALKVL